MTNRVKTMEIVSTETTNPTRASAWELSAVWIVVTRVSVNTTLHDKDLVLRMK